MSVPEDFFECTNKIVLNRILSQFVLETKKTNGEPYPPSTLHQLMCGLLRHMRAIKPECPNFLDKKDTSFAGLGVMDSVFHRLHSEGLGTIVDHAKTISKEDEDKLWASGIMGIGNPKALQNAAFYIVGKMFCLRGGTELRNLKPSQIRRMNDPNQYIYNEHVSKTNNGTFKKLHVKSKNVPILENPEAGERCPVFILDMYFSKLPDEAFKKDIFFPDLSNKLQRSLLHHGILEVNLWEEILLI